MVLRIYERTADRLLINTYYTSKQNPEEIYAGTIHLERYDMAQTMESFSYMGIIDLLMLQTDSQILGLTDVFEDVQMAKHAAAHALGIYLMAICDQPWSDEAVTGGQETPAMMMGKEKEELQQLREEKSPDGRPTEKNSCACAWKPRTARPSFLNWNGCARNSMRKGRAANRTANSTKTASASRNSISKR